MGQYTSYYLYQKYEQRGEQEAIPVYPNVYSIDADGTRERVVKIQDDPQCGYDPPVKPIYKWVNIPITQDYVCDDCPTYQTRWVRTDETICSGTPTPVSKKLVATYTSGITNEVECNDNTTLTSGETQPSGYVYSAMTSAVIGDCVIGIDEKAFQYCRSLTSVTLRNSVTSIAEKAFQYCSSLTSVTIPDSVTWIAEKSFDNCNSLTSITVNATTPPTLERYAFDNTNNCPIYVPCQSVDTYKTTSRWSTYADRIQGIPPCGGNKKLVATYTSGITNEVDCNDSTTLTSGETQPSGYVASAMTSAVIGNCVTSIGYKAFKNCSGLTSIDIPDSVTDISYYAFDYCVGLQSIDIPTGVTSISYSTFRNCGLTSVSIPNSVTSISEDALRQCHSLTSVTIGSGVTTIGVCSFYLCTSLRSINIPNSVTSIGGWAFAECSSLTSVTIGSGVTSISEHAFYFCSSLTSVTVNATTPPTLGYDAFYSTNNCPIYVPASSVNAYKTAENWSTYASRIFPIT